MPCGESADFDIFARRVLQVHHPGARPAGSPPSGTDERVAVAAVEADGDVAGELDVLALVVADGHLVGVVEQDVGRLQRGVGEQSAGDELGLAFADLSLNWVMRRSSPKLTLHSIIQASCGVLGDVALHEHAWPRRGRGRRRSSIVARSSVRVRRPRPDPAAPSGRGGRRRRRTRPSSCWLVDPLPQRAQVVAEVERRRSAGCPRRRVPWRGRW